MKKIFPFLLFAILACFNSNAEERVIKLNKLFQDLKLNNPELSFEVEQKIWEIWSTHPKNENLTIMLFGYSLQYGFFITFIEVLFSH